MHARNSGVKHAAVPFVKSEFTLERETQ